MTNVTEYDPVGCPVADCEYRDGIRSVAGHVSGAEDAAHSWDRLGYANARDFVMTEKRRQMGDGDGTPATDAVVADANGDAGADGGADGETTDERATAGGPEPDTPDADSDAAALESDAPEPFELGFERDVMVLFQLARESDFDSLDDLDAFELVNLYTLLSDLRGSAEAARKDVRDVLLEKVHDDREISSDLGSVERRTYRRQHVKDEETVRAVLRDADVDPASVRSFDKSKLTDAVEDTDIEAEAVFDVEEKSQIRKADTDDEQRRRRFEGLPDDLREFVTDS